MQRTDKLFASSDADAAPSARVETIPLERQYSCVQTGTLLSGGSFEHLHLTPPVHPENPGAPIVVAPGTPMSWQLMQKFLSYLAENGHDVYSLMHEPKGDPREKRPEAIQVLLEKIFEVLSDGEGVHLVGHSYGAIDLARVLSEALADEDSSILDRIASLTLLNPAGLRDRLFLPIISPFFHMSRFLRYVLPAILSKNLVKDADELAFLRSWFRLSLQTPLVSTLREVSDITRTDIDGVLVEISDKGIPVRIIQSAPDTLLYPNGLCEMFLDRYETVDSGDHNGPLIDPVKYGGQKILKTLRDIEERSRS